MSWKKCPRAMYKMVLPKGSKWVVQVYNDALNEDHDSVDWKICIEVNIGAGPYSFHIKQNAKKMNLTQAQLTANRLVIEVRNKALVAIESIYPQTNI